ncbi:Os12g0115950 [Oryza sativa Japonica Group]|uniref:Os12g0115950 protein n=1 Tax=Oryza sativa subsp. japonica TaxID=39947 RepID=A0A0P0Y654_ORYSJ|nr:Os12g0115950 [Oryza sativa Japonica Group]
MPSCFTLDSASDDGRSTAQGQGWCAGVGGFLSSFFSAGAARADGGKPSPDWDAHGLAASALPVPLSRLDGKKRYKVSELTFLDRRTRAAAEDPLFDALRPGGVYTRAQLRDELDALAASGMFDHVTFQTKPCVLPEKLQRELQGMVKKQRKVSSGLLKRMAGRIERWYHDEGFQCAQVVGYNGNLDAGEVVCEVVEGDITKVEYQFVEAMSSTATPASLSLIGSFLNSFVLGISTTMGQGSRL